MYSMSPERGLRLCSVVVATFLCLHHFFWIVTMVGRPNVSASTFTTTTANEPVRDSLQRFLSDFSSSPKDTIIKTRSGMESNVSSSSEDRHPKNGRRKGKAKPATENTENLWNPQTLLGGKSVDLKINLPVFVPSLPKSGTTSLFQYFSCGGVRASHQWVKGKETRAERSGLCIKRNVAANRAPFEGCGDYDVYTDTGYVDIDKKTLQPHCFYPSVDALEAIAEHYPNATFVMAVRQTESWYKSIANWAGGSLLKRWRRCNATGFPGWTLKPRRIKRFYDRHNANIRRFLNEHPSINYIEVSLESEETGKILEREIGIPAECWGKCAPNSQLCKKLDERQRKPHALRSDSS